jgi:PAS domain S-box-containing protein
MWDVATPVMVGDKQFGNLFMGQFFFEDEPIDYELFRTQAKEYGFDEKEYIAALEAAPRLSRETLNTSMSFFMKLADILSKLSYSNIKLARSLSEREALLESLCESGERLKRAQEIAHLGSWELDLVNNVLSWSDEVYRIFGLKPQEFGATYEAFLEAVHPDDRAAVDAAYAGSLREGRDSYEIEHRVVRNSSGEVRIVQEKCEHFRDESGRIVRSVGMVHDITARKLAEEMIQRHLEELRQNNEELTRFNSASVGREMRMIELKKEINDLCEKACLAPRYPLDFAE